MNYSTKNVLSLLSVATASLLFLGCGDKKESTDDTPKGTPTAETVTVQSILPIKKTGQTISYNNQGVEVHDNSLKDDAYYQTGTSSNFTRVADVVTDELTGFMWQDNLEAAIITKPMVTKENYNNADYNNTSGDTATTYCSSLTLGGYSDWSIPTRSELESILDYSGSYPAIYPIFKNTKMSHYWSSTLSGFTTGVSSNNGTSSKITSIYGGVWIDSRKSYSNYIRCVRNTQATPNNTSSLTWEKDTSADRKNFEEAVGYCNSLTLKGNSEWRLPSINELAVLIDDKTEGIQILNSFGKSYPNQYWSSSTEVRSPERALLVSFGNGYINSNTKTSELYVKCVREQ